MPRHEWVKEWYPNGFDKDPATVVGVVEMTSKGWMLVHSTYATVMHESCPCAVGIGLLEYLRAEGIQWYGLHIRGTQEIWVTTVEKLLAGKAAYQRTATIFGSLKTRTRVYLPYDQWDRKPLPEKDGKRWREPTLAELPWDEMTLINEDGTIRLRTTAQ